MNKPVYCENWNPSWKASYGYDQQEVFNEISVWGYAYAYQNRQKVTLDLVKNHVAPGGKVLDVAAAQGNFSLLLAEAGYEVTWNDLRGDLLDYVRLKQEFGEITYAVGDVFGLGYDACFDAVLITEIIEHVAHPDQFLAKIAALVRPGGHIIMTTPNGAYFLNNLPRFSDCPDPSRYEAVQFKPNSDGHIFLLWPDEIKRLGENIGLKLVDQKVFTNLLTTGHLKTKYILMTVPRSAIFMIEACMSFLPKFILNKIMIQTAVCYKKL
jgi:2-polyprenyl-6-hydroxyphenyl methylase/3-demethylubiquinone-9 3-methyltransferase